MEEICRYLSSTPSNQFPVALLKTYHPHHGDSVSVSALLNLLCHLEARPQEVKKPTKQKKNLNKTKQKENKYKKEFLKNLIFWFIHCRFGLKAFRGIRILSIDFSGFWIKTLGNSVSQNSR